MNTLLLLNIDQNTCLQFVTEVEDNSFINLYNTYISIWLKNPNDMLCLRKTIVGYDLYYLAEHIQKSIDGQNMVFDELGMNFDLGLLLNDHSQKIMTASKLNTSLQSWEWVGDKIVFLECNSNGDRSNNTFLYNDEVGNIVLQVSSVYPWFFKDAPSSDLDVSYDDWLPQYKILYKTVIPKDVAQKWVKDLRGLYAMLELNT